MKVTKFDASLADLAGQMLRTMYTEDGLGLAAPQVGHNLRLMVFNNMAGLRPPEELTGFEQVLVNPVITKLSEEKVTAEEGCLSFPHIYGQVERSQWITVDYQSLTGDPLTIRFEGEEAQVFQHEYDHLEKILLVDRIDEDSKMVYGKRIEKMIKWHGPGGAL